MKSNNVLLAAGVFAAALTPGALAGGPVVLYNNSTTDLNTRYDPGTSEVGNQVTLKSLGGTSSKITEFEFQYWGTGFSGTESLEFRIYANNGPNWDATYKMPGTMLFDSGIFGVPATSRQLVVFDTDFGSGLLVPNSFTWTVQFSSLGPSANAGVDGYGPPTVGSFLDDIWVNTGTSWDLRATGIGKTTPQQDFAAEIFGVVPEPSQYGLMFGAICLVPLVWKSVRGQAK